MEKGQSGNPKGRPKKAQTVIVGKGDAVAFIGRVTTDSPIMALQNGQPVHSTRLVRWTYALMERADAGDVRAIRTLLGYAAQWDRAKERAGKKGSRQIASASLQKLKFGTFTELQFAPSPAPAPIKSVPKRVPGPLIDHDPPPDYSTWLKLHPDEPRRPADPPADNSQKTGRKQAKDQAE